MERVAAVLATVAVGALIALQPPVNAQLSRFTGVLGAAFVSTAISALALTIVMAVTGSFGELKDLGSVPPGYLTGGLMGAVLVTVSLVTVRTLGAGGVVAATVGSQIILSAVLDRLGVLGLEKHGLTPMRLAGFGLLIVGIALVTAR
jgi:transporter family-2 protein